MFQWGFGIYLFHDIVWGREYFILDNDEQVCQEDHEHYQITSWEECSLAHAIIHVNENVDLINGGYTKKTEFAPGCIAISSQSSDSLTVYYNRYQHPDDILAFQNDNNFVPGLTAQLCKHRQTRSGNDLIYMR